MKRITFAQILRMYGVAIISYALGLNQVVPWESHYIQLTTLYAIGIVLLVLGFIANEDWEP